VERTAAGGGGAQTDLPGRSGAAARERLQDFDRGPWGQKYPAIAQSSRRNWEQVIPYFVFAPDLRKILYTTNAIERAYQFGVQLDFIRPGKPVENSYIESFNGRLRDECLNVEVFFALADMRDKLERWRQDYNQVRPHGALRDNAPALLRRNGQRPRRPLRNQFRPQAGKAATGEILEVVN
jgi:putative transposase